MERRREEERKERGERKRKEGRREGGKVCGKAFFPEVQSSGVKPWACRASRGILFSIIEVCLDALGVRLE